MLLAAARVGLLLGGRRRVRRSKWRLHRVGECHDDGGIDDGAKAGAVNAGFCSRSSSNCIPGCGNPPQWCRREGVIVKGRQRCPCSFGWCNGRPNPYKPEDLGSLLEQFDTYGEEFTQVGVYKGYNEMCARQALTAA